MVDDPVAVLQRWADAGGVWRVIGRRGGEVIIGLLRCDGGEQVDVVRSADPALVAFVGARQTSLD